MRPLEVLRGVRDVKKHLRPNCLPVIPIKCTHWRFVLRSRLGGYTGWWPEPASIWGHLTVCLAHADCSPCGLSSKPYSHQSKRQHYRQCIHKDNKVWGGAIHSQSLAGGQSWDWSPARQVPLLYLPSWKWSPGQLFLLLSIYLYYLLNMCEALS